MKLTIAALIVLTATVASAQAKRMSGGGGLSPTVAATWEAWDGKLDLLVLWRGAAGWTKSVAVEGPGYPMRVHAVVVGGRRLELRVENNVAYIQDQSIPLQGVNVLMLDDVDQEKARVAGTLMVEPQLSLRGDPIMAIITSSTLLTDFVGR